MTDAKLDLIAKLLAKAESTTPEEAEALTEHAERLMVKYGIGQALLDERRARLGETQDPVVEEQMLFTGAYARDLRELGGGVARALGTIRPLIADSARGSVLYLVGFASDVQQARVLIASLRVQALVAMRAWWLIERASYDWCADSDRRRARSGFVRGFGAGAAARIAENRRAIIEEAGSGTDLVLASRRSRVDAHVDALSPRRGRRRQGADAGAFASGHRSGRQANTGEAAIGARRGLPR
ncbi:DUF2786 domain-containing protein [Microbacterium barkeri]|uniref:DUF2786 domain-containing protein n=1 Tax=Microbacterium barkeri TaxID=33917 RepID=UPI0024AEA53A|nr:DUF2786 domain-containing protein [Microbacterium barkeri]MDI6943207.1 DUF2786 domain-containing protein [Microbacterium barkeri]